MADQELKQRNSPVQRLIEAARARMKLVIVGILVLVGLIALVWVLMSFTGSSGPALKRQLERHEIARMEEVMGYPFDENTFLRYSWEDVIQDYNDSKFYLASTLLSEEIQSGVESLIRILDDSMRRVVQDAAAADVRKRIEDAQNMLITKELLTPSQMRTPDNFTPILAKVAELDAIREQLAQNGVIPQDVNTTLFTRDQLQKMYTVVVQQLTVLEELRRELLSTRPLPQSTIQGIEKQVVDILQHLDDDFRRDATMSQLNRAGFSRLTSQVAASYQMNPCEFVHRPMRRMEPRARPASYSRSSHKAFKIVVFSDIYYEQSEKEFSEMLEDRNALWQQLIRQTMDEVEPERLLYAPWRQEVCDCILERMRNSVPDEYRSRLNEFSISKYDILVADLGS